MTTAGKPGNTVHKGSAPSSRTGGTRACSGGSAKSEMAKESLREMVEETQFGDKCLVRPLGTTEGSAPSRSTTTTAKRHILIETPCIASADVVKGAGYWREKAPTESRAGGASYMGKSNLSLSSLLIGMFQRCSMNWSSLRPRSCISSDPHLLDFDTSISECEPSS
jgi:hypothetical protein